MEPRVNAAEWWWSACTF